MKKRISIVSIVIGFAICLYVFFRFAALKYYDSIPLVARASNYLLDWNDIDVAVRDNLNTNEFKIVNVNSGNVVFENGNYTEGIKNEYGFCLFDVYYRNSLLFQIGHDKFSNWHTNNYKFIFKRNNGEMDATLQINGPDKDKGELFYKRFDRNNDGAIWRVVYMNYEKEIYNQKFLKLHP